MTTQLISVSGQLSSSAAQQLSSPAAQKKESSSSQAACQLSRRKKLADARRLVRSVALQKKTAAQQPVASKLTCSVLFKAEYWDNHFSCGFYFSFFFKVEQLYCYSAITLLPIFICIIIFPYLKNLPFS